MTPQDSSIQRLLSLPEREQTLCDHVVEHLVSAADYTLMDINQEGDALAVDEKFWLSYECLLTYLCATDWNADAAIKRLEYTLKWSREFGIYDTITPEYIEPEVRGSEFFEVHDEYE